MRPGDDGYMRWAGVERRGIPSDDFTTRPAVFEWKGAPLKDPVWVDLLSGRVYSFPKDRQVATEDGIAFIRVPVYDSPCILTERSAVMP